MALKDLEAARTELLAAVQAVAPGVEVLDHLDVKCVFLYVFGRKPSKQDVHALFRSAGCPVDVMSIAQLVQVLTPYWIRRPPDDGTTVAFAALDRHQRGYVDRDDFRAAVATVAPHLSAQIVDNAFSDFDTHAYGKVTLRQYTALTTSRPQHQLPHVAVVGSHAAISASSGVGHPSMQIMLPGASGP
jgi:Ca2+-binding EF-hand superfamily protein